MDTKTTGTPRELGPFNSGDTLTVTPFIDGPLVGYKAECNGVVSYTYFNPSDGGDSPDFFVYQGEQGDPEQDEPLCFFNIPGQDPGH